MIGKTCWEISWHTNDITHNGFNVRTVLLLIGYILSGILIIMVRMYQVVISPLIKATMGDVCRFYPSCSQYFIEAVRKYGPVRGAIKGVWRVIRCNPWCKGGYDPP